MSNISKQAIKLSYYYTREDKDLRDQLEKTLSGLKRHYHLSNWYDREISAGQNWETVWLDEGIPNRNLKHCDEDLAAFEQALLLDPNYLEARREKGITLYTLKHYDAALSTFEQVLHLNPSLALFAIAKRQTQSSILRGGKHDGRICSR